MGVQSTAPSRVIVTISGREAVLVLREQAAVALRVRAAAAGALRLLLCVEEPPACSTSPLHGVLVPRLVKVWLHHRFYVQFGSKCEVLLFMLEKEDTRWI